jgi:hypothetical protein
MGVLGEKEQKKVRELLGTLEQPVTLVSFTQELEFPQLAMRYRVMGVPKTVINEEHAVDGMMAEEAFVDAILAKVKQA